MADTFFCWIIYYIDFVTIIFFCLLGIPIEECPVVCPRENAPICATDGNTYINECIMKANAPGSTTVYDGQCGTHTYCS